MAQLPVAYAQNILPDMATSGQGLFQSRDFVTFGQKTPLGDMAQLPVAHAHSILPDRASSSHVTDVTSGHFRSSMRNGPILIDPPQMRLELYLYITPFWYG